jgi:hypothetical protein
MPTAGKPGMEWQACLPAGRKRSFFATDAMIFTDYHLVCYPACRCFHLGVYV